MQEKDLQGGLGGETSAPRPPNGPEGHWGRARSGLQRLWPALNLNLWGVSMDRTALGLFFSPSNAVNTQMGAQLSPLCNAKWNISNPTAARAHVWWPCTFTVMELLAPHEAEVLPAQQNILKPNTSVGRYISKCISSSFCLLRVLSACFIRIRERGKKDSREQLFLDVLGEEFKLEVG